MTLTPGRNNPLPRYCECADPACPVCKSGKCTKRRYCTLYRVDMEDATGSDFCKHCAADAMESGLFCTAADLD